MRWRDIGLGLVTTLVLWQLLAWAIQRPVLPPPHKVLVAFAQDMPGDLGRHFLISAWRVCAAIALSVAAGIDRAPMLTTSIPFPGMINSQQAATV